ncbi:monovalent cation/H(+) antiporter subunit G [Marispirochaeta aestuarii]|uniref:monovalent cation/H(+) antiporter subunit G n=1 Tax=Marispirochaeta aestuarii TaxID=1963862 RepID=UPI002ABDEDA2|nr:monovalent cation/H(+) antiporter subunit G [Marispirochaeta aestuarii]
MTIAAAIFFGLGIIFNLMGNIGVLVFPDVYTRLQASSTCATTSVLSFFIGCMFIAGWGPMTGRLIVITIFFFVTNPISAHIIARFAWQNGIVPWRQSYIKRRELGGDDD